MTGLNMSSSPQINISECGASCKAGTESDGFSGFAAGVNLADMIQLACLESKERKLLVLAGHRSGEIFFSKGEVVHCSTGKKQGEEAFYEMLSWDRGSFKFVHEATDVRTIEIPWNFLLIEALRIKDEKKAHAENDRELNAEVLIVDDSRFFVSRLKDFFSGQLGATILGEASNGKEALDFLSGSVPDLITLDINMPVMAGDVALKHIMIKSPAPVVLVSNFNERHAGKIMEFLRLGAVDFIAKPTGGQPWEVFASRLAQVVSQADRFRIKNIRRARNLKPSSEKRNPGMPAEKMIVVVGGFGALLEIQKILPALDLMDRCGLVVFQEMCPLFASPAASYLEPHCRFAVKELGSGAPLLSNQAWISPLEKRWKIKADESGAGIYSDSEDNGAFDIGGALGSLADIFHGDLAVVVLSGAQTSIVDGLQHVVLSDGKVLVQKPETSLHPLPLEQLNTLELATTLMAPEDIAPYLNAWVAGGS